MNIETILKIRQKIADKVNYEYLLIFRSDDPMSALKWRRPFLYIYIFMYVMYIVVNIILYCVLFAVISAYLLIR